MSFLTRVIDSAGSNPAVVLALTEDGVEYLLLLLPEVGGGRAPLLRVRPRRQRRRGRMHTASRRRIVFGYVNKEQTYVGIK